MENPMHPKTIRLNSARRCNARTRKGTPCKCPAMNNGRCRMHGGKSTGRPVKHGRYTKAVIARRKAITILIRQSREMAYKLDQSLD